MSLKAKLEAVIYAAEEPVTLAQLCTLFTADALEWKAEQEAVSAAVAAESANQQPESIEPSPLLNGQFAYLEPDQEPASFTVSEPSTSPDEPTEVPASELDKGPASEPIAQASPAAQDEAEPQHDDELDARRQTRQRDREVRTVLRQLLDELIASYASDNRGVEIREIAGGYRMATKPECHDAVRSFVKSLKPALRLSLPALETLAVIAYKQPVTAPEVNDIRGVESAGVLGTLLARKLIATAGRKQVIGRPILYKTTREFLLRFGLKDVSELPSMEEFEKMAAIELDEPESPDAGELAYESEPNRTLDSNLEFDESATEQPMEESDPANATESAETPLEPEKPVVTTAQNLAETPTETAAEPIAAHQPAK
jgi:segregation and condensation protein B